MSGLGIRLSYTDYIQHRLYTSYNLNLYITFHISPVMPVFLCVNVIVKRTLNLFVERNAIIAIILINNGITTSNLVPFLNTYTHICTHAPTFLSTYVHSYKDSLSLSLYLQPSSYQRDINVSRHNS